MKQAYAALRLWMKANKLDIGLAFDMLKLLGACILIGYLLRGLH